MEFPWKSKVATLSIQNGPKEYGFYRKKGKTFLRNYHRELKNGNGLSQIDLLKVAIKEIEKSMLQEFRRFVYACDILI